MIVPEVTTLRRHLEAQHSVSLSKPISSTASNMPSYPFRQNTAVGPRTPTLNPSYRVTSKSARTLWSRLLGPWIVTSGILLRLFLPLSLYVSISDRPFQNPYLHSPFRQPRHLLSTVTLCFSITCRRGSPSPLSRTLTHYAYFLIFLSPTPCTIPGSVVAGLSQAFLVFNLS